MPTSKVPIGAQCAAIAIESQKPMPKRRSDSLHADNGRNPPGGQCSAIAKADAETTERFPPHRKPPLPTWRAMLCHCQRITQTYADPETTERFPPRRQPPQPTWRAMLRHCQRITQTKADAETTERFPPRRQRPQLTWRAMLRHCQRITQIYADAETTERFPPRRKHLQAMSSAFPWSTARRPRDADRSWSPYPAHVQSP